MIQPSSIRRFEAILAPAGCGFRMRERRYPWSVSPQEGRYLYECARLVGGASHRAVGLEIATAFGYSAAWIAAGLSWSRGRLVTMDSYVEETTDDLDPAATKAEPAGGIAPLGMFYAARAAELIGAERDVYFGIGKSPERVIEMFVRGLDAVRWDGAKADLFFLDGHHLNGQPLLDWKAAVPLLSQEGSVVLMHDSHVGDVKEAVKAAENFFGRAHVNPALPGYNLVAMTANRAVLDGLEAASRVALQDPYGAAA